MIRDLHRAEMVVLAVLWGVSAVHAGETVKLSSRLQNYLDARKTEFDQIPPERKESLKQVAMYIRGRASAGEPAKLTFICTHNSRRSHMGQLWALASAAYYQIDNVEAFSGGTEATAFNPRAVAALERAGFKIEKGPEKTNPRYRVYLAAQGAPLVCFSKVYFDEPNPKKDYCAVMTCAQADKACPMVRGASVRVAIPYVDPKAADGTSAEKATYDERCAQIAREVLYIFSLVKGSATASIP